MTSLEAHGVLVKALPRLELRCSAGLHALVVPDASAGAELVAVLAGLARPRRGAVRFHGKSPYTTPELRRATGTLLLTEEPWPGRTVEESLGRALALHQSALTAEAVLQASGLTLLSRRSPAAIAPAEQRAVALALALALVPASLLVLHEPFATSLGRSRVLWALTERGSEAVVVAVTASFRDARALGGSVFTLSPSGFVPWLPGGGRDRGAVELIASVSDPRRLLTAITQEGGATDFECEARAEVLVLRGPDGERMSQALLGASEAAAIPISRLSHRIVAATAPRDAPLGEAE